MNKDRDCRNLFDFPCSRTFREYESEQFGEYLPHIEPKEKPPQDVEAQLSLVSKVESSLVEYRVVEHRVIKTNDRQLTRKVNDNTNALKYLLEKEKGGKKKPVSYF